jgi:hypothetical protein
MGDSRTLKDLHCKSLILPGKIPTVVLEITAWAVEKKSS